MHSIDRRRHAGAARSSETGTDRWARWQREMLAHGPARGVERGKGLTNRSDAEEREKG
jgi:hypothetical protein